MRMIDVEPRAVGEDDIGESDLFVGELARVGALSRQLEPAGVAQRALLLEVPPGPPRSRRRRGVCVTTCDDVSIEFAAGLPGTAMPYSVSIPTTRRALMRRA